MFKAKKSLGQNFLNSSEILDKIIETASLQKEDIVLEVGPGKGSLTEKLLEKSGSVIAIEKDNRLIEFLQEKFAEELKSGKLTLIHNDILDIDIETLNLNNYKIVANIPYYITGKLIRKFLSSDFQPSQMILMLQKEVAQRITSTDKTKKSKKKPKESILSLSIKVYANPKYIKTIPAKYFSPQPKVDSAILLIDNISTKYFEKINEEKFFNLIHQAFSSKRKMLLNNISLIPKKELIKILEDLNISTKIRAEDLSLEDWRNLYNKLFN